MSCKKQHLSPNRQVSLCSILGQIRDSLPTLGTVLGRALFCPPPFFFFLLGGSSDDLFNESSRLLPPLF